MDAVETSESSLDPPSWWSAEDLQYRNEYLHFGTQNLEEIAREGTPVYVLRAARATENLRLLKSALPDLSVYYAIKANRHPKIAESLRAEGLDGIDVCSPAEAALALSYGFAPETISYTGTSVSNADLDFLLSEPKIQINVDSLSALRRLLERNRQNGSAQRKEIGLRINPELGLGYHQEERLTYSGQDQMSKFGILMDQVLDALALAYRYGVAITTLHWHVGCGWLPEQKEEVRKVLRRGIEFASFFPDLERLNLGGGIGVPLCETDHPWDLSELNEIYNSEIQHRWQLRIEPGAYLVQNSTVLLVEVATVERKRDTWFIGINSGFNLLIEPVFYGMPSEIVPLRKNGSELPRELCRFAGNINEAHDMLPQTHLIPLPNEGDHFALLNAGAYGRSMASQHCLRGCDREIVVD